jgi:hypothetical protein
MLFPREIHDPIPCNVARATIENLAEAMAKRLNFRQSWATTSVNAADDMINLITRLNGKVMEAPVITVGDTDKDEDSLIVFDENDFTVFPSRNPLMSERLERSQAMFLGHEIGHRFLHYPMVRSAHPDKDGQSLVMVAKRYPDEQDAIQAQCNTEAYWFAHVLLFPAVLFRELWERHHGSINRIASASRVLPTTVENRAKRLGLLDAQQMLAA